MVAHTLKPSSWEANARGSLSIQGQPSLLSELQNSQNHLETLPQKERKNAHAGVCVWGGETRVITPFKFRCLICPRPYFNPHHYKQSRETKIVWNILRFFFFFLLQC